LYIAEEASPSRSETETEDSATSLEKRSAAVKAPRDDMEEREQSDDSSTDVEDSETSKPNIIHAGDGDKADGTLDL